MNIIFVAPPAAGKGTYSTLLKEKYGYNHISPGELFRSEINNKTELGWEVENIMNKGGLVSDDITKQVIENKLKTLDTSKPFILDGYPRTLNQIPDLESILNNLNLKIDKVLFIDISKEVGLKRKLSRIYCPNCKRGYNLESKDLMPKVDMICDDCNTPLVRRGDDTEEAYTKLYNIYMEETYPVIEYFKNKNILETVNGEENPNIVFEKIKKLLGVNND